LKNNESVVLPYYDYENEVLVKQCREILSAQVSMIFVEGMFIYKIAKLRELFDFNIFVEVDDDIRLSRMRKLSKFFIILIVIHENRFMKSNPKALKSFFIIYEKFIKGSYEVNVEPTKKYANLILPNFDITPDDEIEDNPSLEFLLSNLQNMIKHRLTLIMHSEHLGIEK
jgi:uridine kinase